MTTTPVSAPASVPASTSVSASVPVSASASASGAVPSSVVGAAPVVGGAPAVGSGGAAGAPVVLELAAVAKTYGEDPPVPALRGVSFTVRRGELVAIVGPSGSGKTTLLQVMGTLEPPTEGVVRINGIDVDALDDRQLAALRSRSIGFVFQQFFLAEYATALENVADGLLYAGVDVRERRERAAEALTQVGLAHRQKFRPGKMSGGERQRVAIARALVGRPAIVLADEPTGNLDSATGASIVALLHQLNAEGATIVVITHDAELAARLPRQVHVLDGRIVSDSGSPQGGPVRGPAPGPSGPVSGTSAPATEAPSRGEPSRRGSSPGGASADGSSPDGPSADGSLAEAEAKAPETRAAATGEEPV